MRVRCHARTQRDLAKVALGQREGLGDGRAIIEAKVAANLHSLQLPSLLWCLVDKDAMVALEQGARTRDCSPIMYRHVQLGRRQHLEQRRLCTQGLQLGNQGRAAHELLVPELHQVDGRDLSLGELELDEAKGLVVHLAALLKAYALNIGTARNVGLGALGAAACQALHEPDKTARGQVALSAALRDARQLEGCALLHKVGRHPAQALDVTDVEFSPAALLVALEHRAEDGHPLMVHDLDDAQLLGRGGEGRVLDASVLITHDLSIV